MTYLTQSYEELQTQVIAALETAASLTFAPKTERITQFYARCLGQSNLWRTKDEGELLALLNVAEGGSSVSDKTYSYAQLLDTLNGTLAGSGGGGGEEDDFMKATVSISSADLQALFTSPKLVIASPGSGNALIIIAASFSFHYGTTPYTNVGTPSLFAGPTSAHADWNCLAGLDNVLGGTADKIIQHAQDLGVDPIAWVEDQGCYLADQQDAASGDGTATLTVIYDIVPV